MLLDRDGVLVRSRRDYLKSPLELDLLPGAAEAVFRLKAAGHPVMVVTNQSAVGRGLISIQQVDAIHAALSERLAEKGAAVDGFFVCPHTPWHGCACRKPQPGLLREAAQSVNCDLELAFMVGDQPSDLEAAWTVGSRAILVLSGETASPPTLDRRVHLAADLSAAAAMILAT